MPSLQDNDDAWRRLLDAHVQEHGQAYYRVAYGVLRSREAAADACQRALLRAWQCRGQLRGPAALRPWLTRIVVNESFVVLRRACTERRVLDERARRPRDRQDHVSDMERRALVIAALGELPEGVRTVVTLRIMQGMSGNEVSQLLGLSPSQVSRWLHEGLERLRVYVDGQ